MKHLPKSTPTEILNDPYGFTYKEMSEVIGEDKARALYTELYKPVSYTHLHTLYDYWNFISFLIQQT